MFELRSAIRGYWLFKNTGKLREWTIVVHNVWPGESNRRIYLYTTRTYVIFKECRQQHLFLLCLD